MFFNTSIKDFQVLFISASRLLLHVFYCGLDVYMENKGSASFYLFCRQKNTHVSYK